MFTKNVLISCSNRSWVHVTALWNTQKSLFWLTPLSNRQRSKRVPPLSLLIKKEISGKFRVCKIYKCRFTIYLNGLRRYNNKAMKIKTIKKKKSDDITMKINIDARGTASHTNKRRPGITIIKYKYLTAHIVTHTQC